jgi:hypothetical protein
MEIELWLDVEEADPENLPEIEKRFRKWYEDGAMPRYNRHCLGHLASLDKPYRYLLDLGQADFVKSIQALHGKLYSFGVKVFISFRY